MAFSSAGGTFNSAPAAEDWVERRGGTQVRLFTPTDLPVGLILIDRGGRNDASPVPHAASASAATLPIAYLSMCLLIHGHPFLQEGENRRLYSGI